MKINFYARASRYREQKRHSRMALYKVCNSGKRVLIMMRYKHRRAGPALPYAILAAPEIAESKHVTTQASRTLETFDNPKPERDYTIRIELPEFTCLCPLTGQPDFATLSLEYVPGPRCVELKALKLYIWSFRDDGAFHEAVTNQILDDIVAACAPRFARLTAEFNVRGGTYPTITAQFMASDWRAPPPVVLP